MNDMSIGGTLQSACLEDIGHRFRGDFFDKCGAVEQWLAEILSAVDAKGKPGAKIPLGERLERVRAVALADRDRPQRILKHAPRVIELLNRFKPYAELRAVLAHSTQVTTVDSAGERVFRYRPAAEAPPWTHLALTETAQVRISNDLDRLCEDLNEPLARLRA